MKNLWEKDRKIIYKELYSQYLQEGYSPKELRDLRQKRLKNICLMKQIL
jgi:hypothetical protein